MPSSPEYQVLIRKRWKRKGLCSMCGVEKKRPGFLTGLDCQERYRKYHESLKLQVIKGYGGKCRCCNEVRYEFLSIDHVLESGSEERRRLGRGMNSGALYRKLIREDFPNTHQILCFNCNMSLGFFGYCPHRPKIRRSIKRRL
jgi:hypothetical protein